jgi:hypothetical protein
MIDEQLLLVLQLLLRPLLLLMLLQLASPPSLYECSFE